MSYETVRRWVNHFGPMIAADLRKRRPKPHTTWHLDEGVPRKHQQQWGCGAA
jgi:putative transposase